MPIEQHHVFSDQGDPINTTLIAMYERYIQEWPRIEGETLEGEAVRFAKFLLEHIGEYEELLAALVSAGEPEPH